MRLTCFALQTVFVQAYRGDKSLQTLSQWLLYRGKTRKRQVGQKATKLSLT